MWRYVIFFVIVQLANGLDQFSSKYIPSLYPDNFISEISTQEKPYALVEFYAPWCPHCQHFDKPFQKVGYSLNSEKKLSRVKVYHVNVVKHPDLATTFKVEGYPTVLVGLKKDFIDQFNNPEGEEFNLNKLASGDNLDAGKLLASANKATNSAVILRPIPKDGTSEMYPMIRDTRVEAHHQAQNEDIIKATAMMLRYSESLLQNGNAKIEIAILRRFVHSLAEHFPVKKCRKSFETLKFVEIEPEKNESEGKIGYKLSGKWDMCGKYTWAQIDSMPWKACQGSEPNLRGYTCGLWTLFHSLLMDGTSFSLIHGWIELFFQCDTCREHFLALTQDYKKHAGNRGSRIMYLWQVHNKVNARLKIDEAANQDGDPKFPKAQWPMTMLCPNCRTEDGEFDNSEVYKFLNNYYKKDGGGDGCAKFSLARCVEKQNCMVNSEWCICQQGESSNIPTKCFPSQQLKQRPNTISAFDKVLASLLGDDVFGFSSFEEPETYGHRGVNPYVYDEPEEFDISGRLTLHRRTQDRRNMSPADMEPYLTAGRRKGIERGRKVLRMMMHAEL